MRNDRERMRDIQEAIAKIEKYATQGKEEFLANELIQSWMLLQLQIIGEAARSMNASTHEQYPEVSWRDIAVATSVRTLVREGGLCILSGDFNRCPNRLGDCYTSAILNSQFSILN
jgi:hypothetical protein